MSRTFGILLALALVFGLAFATDTAPEPPGEALGVYGCTSGGATADNPGGWLQALAQHPWYDDIRAANGGADPTPKQMAEKENLMGAGAGETPTVGAFIKFFCGNS